MDVTGMRQKEGDCDTIRLPTWRLIGTYDAHDHNLHVHDLALSLRCQSSLASAELFDAEVQLAISSTRQFD